MEYFTAKELKSSKRNVAQKEMGGYEGRNLKDDFAVKLTSKYCEKLFPGQTYDLKVLDYGPASGVFQVQLANRGFKELYGLDIDDYRDADKKHLFKDFKTADLSYDKIGWPDNFFDVIPAWCILPHLENPHQAIRETVRILKPGGLFILSIPYLGSRASVNYFLKHKDFARYHPKKNHIFAFTPGIFQSVVLRHFNLVKQEFLIDPRSLQGPKGKIRQWILEIGRSNPRIKDFFENLWGYNQIWILR